MLTPSCDPWRADRGPTPPHSVEGTDIVGEIKFLPVLLSPILADCPSVVDVAFSPVICCRFHGFFYTCVAVLWRGRLAGLLHFSPLLLHVSKHFTIGG